MLELQSRFKPLLSKRASLVLALWGEAGIGKSHAASEVLQALPCRHARFHATTPVAALIAQLPPAKKLPLWAERILERVVHGEPTDPSQLISALAALLSQLAPFVLYLEDVHEADAERLALINNLAQALLRVRGAALIVSSRVEPPEVFTALRLKPLARPASDALLEQKMNARLPTAALGWIYNQAQGNPLYTLEYLRYLSRQGYLWSDGSTWHWRSPEARFIPTTVEALIAQLINQATSEPLLRYVLETKAILPLNVNSELWANVARVSASELQGAVRELSRQGIFYQQQFIHPLFREITQQMLTQERRQHLARRAITALADDPEQAALFLDDAQLEPETATEILEHAVEQAAARGQELVAARYLAQAVHYAQGELRSQLAFQAAQRLQGKDDHEALRLARLAIEFEHTDLAVCLLAELLAGQHQLQEAEALLQTLSANQQNDTLLRQRARIYATAADFHKLLELVSAHPELSAQDAYIGYVTSYSYLYTNRTREAETLAHELLTPQLKPHERARFLGIFEAIARDSHEYERALQFSDERIALYRLSEQTASLASALEQRALLLEILGNHNEQLHYLQEAQQLFAEVGVIRRLAGIHADLGYALIQHGRYEEAEETLLQAQMMLASLDASDSHLLVEAFLALLYYEWRPPHAAPLALYYARRVLQFTGDWLWPIMKAGTYWTTALIESWLGDPKRALEIVQTGIETAQALNFPNILGANYFAQGLAFEKLGALPEAYDRLEQAVRYFETAGFKERALRAALELDRLRGDMTVAKDHLHWFETRQLNNGVTIIRRYFPQLDNAVTSVEPASMHIEILGPLRLKLHHKSIAIRGQKRQNLLQYLLEARIAGRTNVSQLDLIERLYPSDPEDVALSALKQLVFQLRKQLGASIILRSGDGYALGNVSSDAEDFLQNGPTQLWRGNYCEDLDAGDDTVAGALYHALYERAAELLDHDSAEASRLGRLLLNYDPYDLKALHLTVRALHSSNQHTILSRLYQASRTALTEVGTRLPEHWTDFLAAQPL